MDKPFSHVTVEREEHIAVLTINRPDKLNALSSSVVNELFLAFHDLTFSRREPPPRAVILTGAGNKAFVAGADIAEMATIRIGRPSTIPSVATSPNHDILHSTPPNLRFEALQKPVPPCRRYTTPSR